MDLNKQPFKVDQQAECTSFLVGYRSAWFRSKIKDISIRRGQFEYYLEFFDYPDEKKRWTQLYEKPPQRKTVSAKESRKELMMRPVFPPFFRESQLPDSYPESDLVAVVGEAWKVGDLVDWWYEDCYWSGRVIQLLGDDRVQIELPEPPIGEGKSYEAFCKDLRPSLDWSPECGWTVPLSKEDNNCWHTARLIQTTNQDGNIYKESEERYSIMESNTERSNTSVLRNSDSPREENPACLNALSNFYEEVKDATVVPMKISGKRDRCSSFSVQEKVTSESKYKTSRRHPNTIDTSILELEEHAIKLRWLKGLLQFGYRWSHAMKSSWRVVENRG